MLGAWSKHPPPLTCSHLPEQSQWWLWGPAPPWLYCYTVPPMSPGYHTGQPEPENASDWAPQSQSYMTHHCRVGGDETRGVKSQETRRVQISSYSGRCVYAERMFPQNGVVEQKHVLKDNIPLKTPGAVDVGAELLLIFFVFHTGIISQYW